MWISFLIPAQKTPRNFLKLLDFWSGDIPGLKSATELEEPGVIIQFGRPPHRIDLLNRIDGVSFIKEWASRVPVSIVGEATLSTYYLGRKDLLANKKASGRPKDLDDVQNLA